MLLDQQKLNEDAFDPGALPKNVSIKFAHRAKLLSYTYSGLVGFFHRCYATLHLGQSRIFSKRTRQRLFKDCLGIPVSADDSLYLFNDRNRLSRLCRTLFSSYHVIEDGLSNYYGWKLRVWEKFLTKKKQKRYIGDHVNCQSIEVLSPHKLAPSIQHKAKKIDFINPEVVRQTAFPFFKLDATNYQNLDNIIATQPIATADFSASGASIRAYKLIIERLKQKGVKVAFKVHPREDETKYKQIFPTIEFIDSKVPLELVLFSSKSKINIFSIYSSVGMGFDAYCRRFTLVKDSEANDLDSLYSCWRDETQHLANRVNQTLQ